MLSYICGVARARRDDGATAVEYGLLVAAIAALIVLAVLALGGIVEKVLGETCDAKHTAGGSAKPCAGS